MRVRRTGSAPTTDKDPRRSLDVDDRLRIGPLLRHVDKTSAAVWLETTRSCVVSITSAGRTWSAATFTVHGHHYALVAVTDLEPGSTSAYAVEVDGERVWPPPESPFPPSEITTLRAGERLRVVFGSCRKSYPHDEQTTKKFGIDALRAYGLRVLRGDETWPDLMLFLGDQVYADETSDEMRDFIASRRDIDEPPGTELRDFEEYTYQYWLAWRDPVIRWLLSTVPTSMIFDDHDVRDDWNTSFTWREQMDAKPWWRRRIQAGLASYWVYQHLGNLSPAERADDEIWRQIEPRPTVPGGDFGALLDSFAERADRQPDTYRWSYARDIATCRLVVIDSRAARQLTPQKREMIDDREVAWLDDQLRGGFDHLLIATSLPFLMANGLHDLEAWDEAVAEGAWGRRLKRFGESVRQTSDLEHWAAFQNSFRQLAAIISEVASGRRGPQPASLLFMSGDVHNSYLAEVTHEDGASPVLQAVCSPVRNPLPRAERVGQAFAATRAGRVIGHLLIRSAGVARAPLEWKTILGPWFENNIATLEIAGADLTIRWERGVVGDAGSFEPGIEVINEYRLDLARR